VRIGELGERAGLSPKTIRYYEQIGLVPEPARLPNGYRDYDGSAVGLLRFVAAAQSIGLTLGEIREVLAVRDRGEAPCGHVLELIERHADDLEQRIGALEAMRKDLVRLAARARRSGSGPPAAYCHIIEEVRPSAARRALHRTSIGSGRDRGRASGRLAPIPPDPMIAMRMTTAFPDQSVIRR
jgi:MerR family copper efflux transcriptional regulator